MDKRNLTKRLNDIEKRLYANNGRTVSRLADSQMAEIDASAARLMFLVGSKYVGLSSGKLIVSSLCPDIYSREARDVVIEWNAHLEDLGEPTTSVRSLLEVVREVRALLSTNPTVAELQIIIDRAKE